MRIFGFLIFIAVFAAASFIVRLLWNAILPEVTGCGILTYWQSAGIVLLSRLLFGGFGAFAGHLHRHHHRAKNELHRKMKDRRHIHEAMEGMTREEKREYIRNFFNREMHVDNIPNDKPEQN
ncbi:MAG: hypothetical protein LIO79_07195 [Rikenellaceae bacterium]|nr:hypothetical protein [Rikenellaceae bacterium]